MEIKWKVGKETSEIKWTNFERKTKLTGGNLPLNSYRLIGKRSSLPKHSV